MYTNIPKPTGTPYKNISNAKLVYDDSLTAYDDSLTFYDGFNPGAYTNLSKPRFPFGAYTWDQSVETWNTATESWNFTGGTYTNINKPT